MGEWWDEGASSHGAPLRGDCRDPWEAEEPWGSGAFEQVGPGAVLYGPRPRMPLSWVWPGQLHGASLLEGPRAGFKALLWSS